MMFHFQNITTGYICWNLATFNASKIEDFYLDIIYISMLIASDMRLVRFLFALPPLFPRHIFKLFAL
jgi:hypothetical protein